MKVVILAGGLGTRLSEETSIKPKPMVEIGGKPILWHIMKIYSHYGFNEFIICLGYKGYLIKEYFANYFLHQSDVTIDLSVNKLEDHNNSAEPWKVTILRNRYNIGLEGNIIKSLDSANGTYIWLLSDHMLINTSNVRGLIQQLENGLEFSIGYATIKDYFNILPKVYSKFAFKELSAEQVSNLIFSMGNISGCIFNREYIKEKLEYIFEFASYSYPHLGAFYKMDNDSIVIETEILSCFNNSQKYVPSYNSFSNRFVKYVLALKIILLSNSLKFSTKLLNIKQLLNPFIKELIYANCIGRKIEKKELVFCFRIYPWKMKILILLTLLLQMLPKHLQKVVSNSFFRNLFPRVYNYTMNPIL